MVDVAGAFRVDSGLHPRSRLSAADGDLPQPIEQTYTLMSKIVDVQNEAGETQCRGWPVEIRVRECLLILVGNK